MGIKKTLGMVIFKNPKRHKTNYGLFDIHHVSVTVLFFF